MNKRIVSVLLSLSLLIGMVGISGVMTAAAEVTVTPVTAIPENNLLAGIRPVSGVAGQTSLSSAYGSAPEWLADGQLCAADNSTGRWVGFTSTGCLIAFNLGAEASIDSFFVSSEGAAAQYADKVKVYVSDTVVNPRDGLFTEDNLVLDVTGLTGQSNLLTLSSAVAGVMVGFDFTGAKCNAGDLIRLGELGAYGTQNAVKANTAVTPVTALPTEDNLLTGLTPISDYGVKINMAAGKMEMLNDGVLCADNGTQTWGGYYGNGDKLVWNLGQRFDINKVLVGSQNSYKEYVKFINVYISDDPNTLFTADSLAFSATGYATGIGANRDNLLSAVNGKAATGQYVGFDFTNNDPALGGSMQSFLRLGELGVYGTVNQSSPSNPTPTAPENNLLAGIRPVSGVAGETSLSSAYGSEPEWLTDGQLCAADNSTGRWVGYTSTGCLIAFNLGATATLDSFFVSSEGAAAQYADKVKIYVSDTVVNPRNDLFVEDNLVLDATGLTGQSNLLRLDEAVSGIMVGFDFTGAKCNAADLIRLGELGAYGTQNAVKANTAVTPVTALPTEDNLLTGLTPISDYGVKINMAAGKMEMLNDGVLCADNGTQTWGGYYGNGDKLTWDLGQRFDISKVLVGSQNSYTECVKFINVYVSDDPNTLFTADSLAFSATGYATGIGANRDNLLSAVDGRAISGRYVGFDFTDNDPERAGSMGYFLRLGELGVYAAPAPVAPVTNKGAQIRDYAEGASEQDIRFGFDVACTDMAYVGDTYVADYTNGKIVIDGETYSIVEMGAMASIMTDKADDLVADDYDDTKVSKVKAVNLYAVEEDKVTFTVVCLNVPQAFYESGITMRSYVAYDDNGTTRYAYGDTVTRTIQAIINQADY